MLRRISARRGGYLWQDIPFDRLNPSSWQEPVVRLGMYAQQPFVDSGNTPALQAAFDQLVGLNQWLPCRGVGTFPVRFPSKKQYNDTGRHVDASFPGDAPANFMEWRVNVKSRGRALLLLILYSDVSEQDAPTIIYLQSHFDVAKLLYPEGEAGLSFMDLAGRLPELPAREKVLATEKAGTVYLCHPFLVHAVQAHTGKNPRFLAQPPFIHPNQFEPFWPDKKYSPVEIAIRQGVGLG